MEENSPRMNSIEVGGGNAVTINYTPDTIDEYIVVVNLPEDWEVVHNYIINENEIDGIPNRKVNCSNLQEFSLRTAIYEMSVAEADILRTHEKVESVELSPDKYPQPASSHAARFGNNVAFPKPLLPGGVGDFTPSYTNNVRSNWSMLFVNDPGSQPYQGVGISTVNSVDRDIDYTVTGNNVDAVIIDSGVSVLHPEFIASDGSYRVFDVILDGPYKADPAAFSTYTTTVTIDGVNIGTRAQEARARQWWSDTTIRSSAFQSLGTLTIPATYTRIHAHSKNGTNAILSSHGTSCAAQIGGKNFGLAFECNLWNIRIVITGDGGVISANTALNACAIFHNAKKAASSDPDPTLINNSYGAPAATNNDSGEVYYYTYRGSNKSYTGSGSVVTTPANSGPCRHHSLFTANSGSGSGLYSFGNGQYLNPNNSFNTTTDPAAENAIAAGCIVVASAGNDNAKLSDKNDTDFDNKYYDDDDTYTTGVFINRVQGVQKGFSGDHDVGKGSIRVGALDCAVEPHDEKQGVAKYKIRKVAYSSNGPMIDIFAPADRSLAAGYGDNETYQRQDNSSFYDRYFSGTSSAGPNACSVIAIYLQSNRGSSQSAIRTWLTGTACKNNLMSDPYQSEGNASTDDLTNGYWSRSYNALLDAATIPNSSYNVGGAGNLRGAPNRVLFNPLVTPDTTAPTLVSTVPATNETGVALNANIVLNFSEAVIAQSGSSTSISIFKADGTLVESITATDSKVTGSGTSQITVNPTSDLAENTTFYVNIDTNAFDDAAGNSFAGVVDATTIRFTTGTGSDPDPDPPTVDGEYSVRFFGNGLILNGQLVIT